MSNEERLAERLLRWEERYNRGRGRDVAPEELCRGCPELIPALRQRIAELKQMGWLKVSEESEGPPTDPPAGAPSVSPPQPPQTRNSPYSWLRLRRLLGRGGFGEVWEAETDDGLLKAVKFVFGDLLGETGGRYATLERRGLDRIKEVRHPYVLQMVRFEEVNGELVIVSELADASSVAYFRALREWADSSSHGGDPCRLTQLLDLALRFIRDAAEALDHIHERHGLQHLDVKPSNLLMLGGHCKVCDFGTVARLERSRTDPSLFVLSVPSENDPNSRRTHWLGSLRDVPMHNAMRREATLFTMSGAFTPFYAPPEAWAGRFSRSFDQYSLALTFCELVSGRLPFTADGDAQWEQRLRGEMSLDFLPARLRPAIRRALAVNPDERFGSCMDFVLHSWRAHNGRT